MQIHNWSNVVNNLAIFRSDIGSVIEVMSALIAVAGVIYGVVAACLSIQETLQESVQAAEQSAKEAAQSAKEAKLARQQLAKEATLARQQLAKDAELFREQQREFFNQQNGRLDRLYDAAVNRHIEALEGRPRWGW
jgi:uncharacterized protein HemX